jgi:hypothetical protein
LSFQKNKAHKKAAEEARENYRIIFHETDIIISTEGKEGSF